MQMSWSENIAKYLALVYCGTYFYKSYCVSVNLKLNVNNSLQYVGGPWASCLCPVVQMFLVKDIILETMSHGSSQC